jgi:hypothetical protein
LVRADVVVLSTLLGVPPGSSTRIPNLPFTTFVDAAEYGVGADCPGDWTNIGIQFSDTAVLTHGLGLHPPESGESRMDFDLTAIQLLTGRRTDSFTARAGIESRTSLFHNGATFEVRLDGTTVFTTTVAGRLSPSVPFVVQLAGHETLSLITTRAGAFNSNHACWGLAEVTLGEALPPACPPDFNHDGSVDFFDYDDFVVCFEDAGCAAGDFNHDGSVDFFDYDDFVLAFEIGC